MQEAFNMLAGTILASATLLVLMTIVGAQYFEYDEYSRPDVGRPGQVCIIDQECQEPGDCLEGEIGKCVKKGNNVEGHCQCFFLPDRCNTTKNCPASTCKEGLHPVCVDLIWGGVGYCICELNPGRCWEVDQCHNKCPKIKQRTCQPSRKPGVPGVCTCESIKCNTVKDCPKHACPPLEKVACKQLPGGKVCECVADNHYCAKDEDCPECDFPYLRFCDKPPGCPYGKCECTIFKSSN